jgi:hypothetical protein
MSKLSDLVKGLKEKIFGEGEPQKKPTKINPLQSGKLAPEATGTAKHTDQRKSKQPSPVQSSPLPPAKKVVKRALKLRVNPHFVQIGFDFGTAYSKCVCRDVMTNKAWVHILSKPTDKELPFLIPSTLLVENDQIKSLGKISDHYPKNGLYHLKLAVEKVALQQWGDTALEPYRRISGQAEGSRLASFVEASSIYFLAGALGDVRRKVQQRLSGFGDHPDDYMAVNLAVPVADAEQPEVNALYHRILCHAWLLADKLAGHPPICLDELYSLVNSTGSNIDAATLDACFIYPEVSANVQGFVRSQASSQGVYLFSDTGAGTVDQSVFIFTRTGNNEHLAYLHGNVLPLGSSCIERYAAESPENGFDWALLERLRKKKEAGDISSALDASRSRIAKELDRGTTKTLALAKAKFFRPEQIMDTRVIFGGGGHCENPYKQGVLSPFSGSLFAQTVRPDVVGLPTPVDLELDKDAKSWLPRLTVAYGLSYEKSELAVFTYPVNIKNPRPEELWRLRPPQIEPPSKDDC